MSILNKAYAIDEAFKNELQSYGKQITSTWMADFTIADAFGSKAVKDTCRDAVKCWKNDPVMMGELTIVLNHKIWMLFQSNEPLARVYNDLWEKTQADCYKRFKGDDLTTYYRLID